MLYRGAKILVFDEPTAVLTPQESKSLLATLRGMAARGYCVVFISHKLDEVISVADRITVLRRGKALATVDAGKTDRHELARLMVGRSLAGFVEHPGDEGLAHGAAGHPVLFDVRGLGAMSDKGTPALDELTFSLRAGEIFGVAGVAGNGQRELAEVITGLRPTTGGSIQLAGEELAGRSPAAIADAGVAHIPEDRLATGLVAGLDVAENAILRDYREPPISKGAFLVPNAIAAFADRLIANYDVKTPSRRTPVGTLSGGNQQKLLIARELAGEPKLIVAVHPTRGVDIGATETIHAILHAQRARGAGILLISEDLDELLALSDRIMVLFGGRAMGTVDRAGAKTDQIGLMMAGVMPDTAAPAESVAADA